MADTVIFGTQITIQSEIGADIPQVSDLGIESIQTNAGSVFNTQTIGTAAAGTLIDLSELVTPGRYRYKNVDTTNYVEVGVQVAGTFYPLDKLLPGEVSSGRVADGVAVYARFNGADGKLQIINADT